MSSGVAGKRSRDWATYKRLLGYVRPYWALFAIAVLGFLVGSGAEAYFVNLFGALVDDWDAGAARAAFFIPLAMLGAAVVRGLGEVVGELLLSQVSFTVVHNLRMALFEQLLRMPSHYFDASSQGHLVSRITFNVAQLRDTGTDALKTIIQDGGKVIVFLGCMLYLNWMLTLIFIAAVPVVAIVVLYASRRFRGIAKRIQNAMGDVTHVASEAIAGYRVVRIFGGEDSERRRFDRASRANRRRNLKMVVTKATSTQVVQILVVAAVALLIATLARPDVAHGLSTGDLVVFLGLAGMLARPIRKLTEVNARLQRGLAAAEDVFSQLDAPVERDRGTLSIDRAKGRVEFRGVSFSYGDDPGTGSPRHQPSCRAGPDGGVGGPFGQRQNDPRQPDPALLRGAQRRGAPGWPRGGGIRSGQPAPADCAGHPTGEPVQRHGGGQHRLRRLGRCRPQCVGGTRCAAPMRRISSPPCPRA